MPVSSKQLKKWKQKNMPCSLIILQWVMLKSPRTEAEPLQLLGVLLRTGQGHLQQGLASNCSSKNYTNIRAPPKYHLLHVLFFSSQYVHIFSSNTVFITAWEIFISVDIICLLQVFPQWHLSFLIRYLNVWSVWHHWWWAVEKKKRVVKQQSLFFLNLNFHFISYVVV